MRSHYTTDSYAKAIVAACSKAGINPWAPNRLRHNAATEIRKHAGVEIARTVLGHASMATTEIYAERDLEKAIAAMREVG
jgi:integrase